jgi:predicted ATPase
LDTAIFAAFGTRPCGAWAIRGGSALIGEAITAAEATKEKWCEAEIHRTAGKIKLMSHAPDAATAEVHFERAIAIAREQKANSWELRAAMSMPRLWHDQGTAAGPRSSRADVRLVHRRLRHA